MIDNFDKIIPLLEFPNDDTYYFVQILQRKKDHKKGKVNGSNNNSRLVKAYYIKSVEHLEFVKPEIIEMCKIFNARAGINLNKRSFEKSQFLLLKKITDQIMNREFTKGYRAFNSIAGEYQPTNDKRWILDVDEIGRNANDMIRFMDNECRPEGSKFITVVPSKNGYHIITKPFDISVFGKKYPDIEIHKNNPTNLFIP